MFSGLESQHHEWHSGDKLRTALREFHEKHASYPQRDICAAQQDLKKTLDTLQKAFQQDDIRVHFEYTGSSYERIKVPSSIVEFDVMVVFKSKYCISEERAQPLYARLSTSNSSPFISKMLARGTEYLVPQQAAEAFQGKLQRIINNNDELKRSIKLKQHGPAVEMDVNKYGLDYSVDMVPSFLVNGSYYVAKPFKEDQPEESGNSYLTWRHSYSIDEKNAIKKLDSGWGLNKCHKQCMRILKVLRDREAGLNRLNSYIIKTAVLKLNRDSYGQDWSQKKIGERFVAILWYLSEEVESGILAHYYEPEANLLSRWTASQCQNVASRLKELVRSEQRLLQALDYAGRGWLTGYTDPTPVADLGYAQGRSASPVFTTGYAAPTPVAEANEGGDSWFTFKDVGLLAAGLGGLAAGLAALSLLKKATDPPTDPPKKN